MDTSPEIAALNDAIAAVMAEVQPIAKEDRNTHGSYNFAGIDAFLSLTRPICAKHKLSIRQDEDGFEVIEVPSKNGPVKMLLMRFAFTFRHGNASDGPYHRSIMVPASMGSQAFGSAQSYALKQFLRSSFQISTGEKDDIDHHDTGELGTYSPPKPVKLEGPYTSPTALKRAVHEADREIRACGDIDMLEAYLQTKEFVALKQQLHRDAPDYLYGGDSLPPEHEPLKPLVDRMRKDFEDIATANHMVDLGNT